MRGLLGNFFCCGRLWFRASAICPAVSSQRQRYFLKLETLAGRDFLFGSSGREVLMSVAKENVPEVSEETERPTKHRMSDAKENVPEISEETERPTKLLKLDVSLDVLRVKKLSAHAVIPKRGSSGAAGYDLASAYDEVVPARGKAVIKTDLSIAVPSGTYARVAPRSGLAVKHFIDVGAGVVDEDYRGNVGVVLFNHGEADFSVKKGDRVAQLILERIVTPEVIEVDDLDDTTRGAGGYGSTGVGH